MTKNNKTLLNLIKIILIGSIFLIAIAPAHPKTIKDTKETETFYPANFSQINISGNFDVKITQGEQASVKITATNEDLLNSVIIKSDKDKLTIKEQQNHSNAYKTNTKTAHINMVVAEPGSSIGNINDVEMTAFDQINDIIDTADNIKVNMAIAGPGSHVGNINNVKMVGIDLDTNTNNARVDIANNKKNTERKEIEITITQPLKNIEINGSVELNYSEIQTNYLSLKAYGSSSCDLSGTTNKLKLHTYNTSSCNLAGKAVSLDASSLGSSNINAHKLIAKDVHAKSYGTSNIKVYTTESLEAISYGSSNILYYGSPKLIKQKSSGTSNISSGTSNITNISSRNEL